MVSQNMLNSRHTGIGGHQLFRTFAEISQRDGAAHPCSIAVCCRFPHPPRLSLRSPTGRFRRSPRDDCTVYRWLAAASRVRFSRDFIYHDPRGRPRLCAGAPSQASSGTGTRHGPPCRRGGPASTVASHDRLDGTSDRRVGEQLDGLDFLGPLRRPSSRWRHTRYKGRSVRKLDAVPVNPCCSRRAPRDLGLRPDRGPPCGLGCSGGN